MCVNKRFTDRPTVSDTKRPPISGKKLIKIVFLSPRICLKNG